MKNDKRKKEDENRNNINNRRLNRSMYLLHKNSREFLENVSFSGARAPRKRENKMVPYLLTWSWRRETDEFLLSERDRSSWI